MGINEIGKSLAASEVSRPVARKAQRIDSSEKTNQVSDSVEISSEAVLTSKVGKAVDPSRQAKIAAIKSQIADGTYLSADKLDDAVNGAIDTALQGL